METHTSQWGNSLGIRIPKAFADKLGIEDGTKLEVSLEGDHLVVTPKKENTVLTQMAGKRNLAALVGQITPENRPNSEDDDVIGNEVW